MNFILIVEFGVVGGIFMGGLSFGVFFNFVCILE